MGRVDPEAVMDADEITSARVIDMLEGAPEPVRQVLRDDVHRHEPEELTRLVVVPVEPRLILLSMTIQLALTSIEARGRLTALEAKSTSSLMAVAAFSKNAAIPSLYHSPLATM